MLTLLSPAKTLDFSPAADGLPTTEPRFPRDTAILRKRCSQLSVDSLRKLMSLSQNLGELNYQRFQEMRPKFTVENSKPCLLAFKGDVYRGLNASTLSRRDLRWAQGRLRILSGLYGILRPLDLIQPYRLEMGSKLSNPRGSDLYAFWGRRLVDSLNEEHSKRRVRAVLNLASNEYFKAVGEDRLKPRLITVQFKEIRDGQAKTIALYAKKARGVMARFVIDNRIDDPEGLKEFREDGYRYAKKLSDEGTWVFTRKRAA